MLASHILAFQKDFLVLCIHPSHLLYRSENSCELESYAPSRFGQQSGYDQLYIGSPNTTLGVSGSFVDGTRAWRHFVKGCTDTSFYLPVEYPKLQMTMSSVTGI